MANAKSITCGNVGRRIWEACKPAQPVGSKPSAAGKADTNLRMPSFSILSPPQTNASSPPAENVRCYPSGVILELQSCPWSCTDSDRTTFHTIPDDDTVVTACCAMACRCGHGALLQLERECRPRWSSSSPGARHLHLRE